MGADEHREHAGRLVGFDKAHAAHVGGEHVDLAGILAGFVTGVFVVEVELEIFDVVEALVPLIERFDVDRADVLVAVLAKLGDEVAADKTAAAGDYDGLIAHGYLQLHCPMLVMNLVGKIDRLTAVAEGGERRGHDYTGLNGLDE